MKVKALSFVIVGRAHRVGEKGYPDKKGVRLPSYAGRVYIAGGLRLMKCWKVLYQTGVVLEYGRIITVNFLVGHRSVDSRTSTIMLLSLGLTVVSLGF